jgi:hypothetical protein
MMLPQLSQEALDFFKDNQTPLTPTSSLQLTCIIISCEQPSTNNSQTIQVPSDSLMLLHQLGTRSVSDQAYHSEQENQSNTWGISPEIWIIITLASRTMRMVMF